MLRVGCADDDMSLTCLGVQLFRAARVADRAPESCFTLGVLRISCSPPSAPSEHPGGGGEVFVATE